MLVQGEARRGFGSGTSVAVDPKLRSRRHSERGYILLLLMLFVTLLTIASLAAAPLISFQVKRDREEEMIHRGVQYSRAIRRFVKKTGNYPVRLEQLENTNNIRYLRKRYKDPVTGKDFKLLHQQDVKLSFGAGIAGANPIGGAAPGSPLAGAAALLGAAAAANSPGVAQTQNLNQADSSDPSQSVSPQGATDTGDKLSATVFGGGAIVGVASVSKDPSIREFNKKSHYNEWQFIYDPTTDRGGLLSTPNQPPLQGSVPNLQPGATGTPGTGMGPGGSSFGSPSMIPQQNPQPPPAPPPPQQ
jgi:type II secretory pathway pseudopilin PulG